MWNSSRCRPAGVTSRPKTSRQLLVQQDQLLYAAGAKTRPFRLTARNKQLAPEDPKHHLPDKNGYKCGCAGGDDDYRVWLVMAGRGLTASGKPSLAQTG